MGVNFTDNGDDTSSCEECGEQIDNDHYADMQAHDDKHAAERARIDSLPRAVIEYAAGGYNVLQRDAGEEMYRQVAQTRSFTTAKTLAAVL